MIPSGHTSVTWCYMANVSMWCLPTSVHKEWCVGFHYTECAGWAVTAGIPVKFCSPHGRSAPEVGSGFPIEAYGSRGVSRPSLVIGNSNQNISANTELLSPKQNFYSLTVCRLDQYLLNGSENTVLLQ